MRYDDYISLFDQAVSNLKGRAFFGKGTLEEMNSVDNSNYPLVWLITPMTINNQFAQSSAEFFVEGYNVTMRVVTSGSLNTDEAGAAVSYNELKIITDAILQQFRETDEIEIQNYNLNQLHKVQDDVHIGWEATFVLVSYLEPDDCCSLAAPLALPPVDDCFTNVENLCNVLQVDDQGTVLIKNLETGKWEIKVAPWLTSESNVNYTKVNGFTPGSIPFADSSGALKQSNANWFYDEANNRVGLGMNTPVTRLDIAGHSLTTQPTGSISSVNISGSLLKNDSNVRSFSGVMIKPTFNTGLSNSGTIFNVLEIDTVNTGITGLTPNLFLAQFGGTRRARITGNGNNLMTLWNDSGNDMFNFNASGANGVAELLLRDMTSTQTIIRAVGVSFFNSSMLALGQTTATERLEVNGNIKTAAPSANGAGAFRIGKVVNGAYVNPDTAKALEIMDDGVVYHVQLVTT